MDTRYPQALPAGYQLAHYRIQTVLGAGGFGITYLGWDSLLHCKVAIKEYFPFDWAVRREDGTTLIPRMTEDQMFSYGLDRFLAEARTLARFKEPTIVRVTNFLEANQTAYMVMEYEAGESLSELLKRKKTLSEEEIRRIVIPVLKGLKVIHEQAFLHRDIKPSNIYLRTDHSPVLLDFGAARQLVDERSRTITGVVTPGYAPFEQYGTRTEQGPWTDLYALGATMYRCVCGSRPDEASERIASRAEGHADPLAKAVDVGRGRYSVRFLELIDWMLQPIARDRPANVQAVLDRLTDDEAPAPRSPGDSSEPLVPFKGAPAPPAAAADSSTTAETRRYPTEPDSAGLAPTQAAPRASAAAGTVTVAAQVTAAAGESVERPPAAQVVARRPFGAVVACLGRYVNRVTQQGWNGPRTATLISAVAVLGIGIGYWLPAPSPGGANGTSVEGPSESTVVDVDNEAASTEVAHGPAPQVVAPPPVEATGDSRARVIAKLLGQANDALAAGRLGAPARDNAREYFERVLALDAGNPTATAGLGRVVTGYLERAWDARWHAGDQPKFWRLAADAVDIRSGLNAFQKAASQGDLQAQVLLGWSYLEGLGRAKDYAQTLRWCRPAAAKGDARAQFLLGHMYARGIGVAQDPQAAQDWLRSASAQGFDPARRELAAVAAKLAAHKAAPAAEERPEPPAQSPDSPQERIAQLMDQANQALRAQRLTRPRGRDAKGYFEQILAIDPNYRPAKLGLGKVVEAYLNLAWKSHQRGNTKSTAAFLRQAADVGIERLPPAVRRRSRVQFLIGLIYDHGYGVRRNHKLAESWYGKAARQGQRAARAAIQQLGAQQTEPRSAQASSVAQGDTKAGIPRLLSQAKEALEGQQLDAAEQFYARVVGLEAGNRIARAGLGQVVVRRVDALWPRVRLAFKATTGPKRAAIVENRVGIEAVRAAALAGDLRAQAALGYLHDMGYGVARSIPQAVRWYRRAAARDDVRAQARLGYLYDKNIATIDDDEGFNWNKQEAGAWYDKAAKRGHSGAAMRYAEIMLGKREYKKAARLFQQAAAQGFVQAQTNLGLLYLRGQGTPADYEQALRWFRKAAVKRDARAQHYLGVMYASGYGVKASFGEAIKWYRKSAKQGYAPAQTNLGWLHEKGFGIERNYRQALKWYRQAAADGDRQAQFHLGHMYEAGLGVDADRKEALRWYEKAAGQGHIRARERLQK